MPYFKDLNLFFIHIPKTGGTSIENYFYDKLHLEKTFDTMITSSTSCKFRLNKHTLQHTTYEELLDNNCFNFNIKTLNKLAVVRNPYDRIVSDMLFWKLITSDMSPKDIEIKLKIYLNDSYNYDNHRLQQYKFVTINNQLVNDITIIATETLTQDMHKLGYTDFNLHVNKSLNDNIDYKKLLTKKAKKIIYKYYKKDFEFFGYNK